MIFDHVHIFSVRVIHLTLASLPRSRNHPRYHLWMSKRQRNQDTRSHAKRSRIAISIGAPSADDRRFPSDNNPSSSALSTRIVRERRPPTLASLCIQFISSDFEELSDEKHWKRTRSSLTLLPDSVIPNLFSALKAQHPRRLSHAVITTVRLCLLSGSHSREFTCQFSTFFVARQCP